MNRNKSASVVSGIKTIRIKEKIDAAAPVFEQQNSGTYTYYKGAKADGLEVYATCGNGGTITYQWYRNSTNSNAGGEEISEATGRIYRPLTDEIGTTYYYAVATNTNTGSDINGKQTTIETSEVSTIIAVQPVLVSLGELTSAITGIAYGAESNAAALGLTEEISIELNMDGASKTDKADISWDLSGYDTSQKNAQTFEAIGTIILPTGVLNTQNILLEVTVSVSVDARPAVPSEYTGIATQLAAITGIRYGTEAAAAALGLPAEIIINTDTEGVVGTCTAAVTWDLSGYDTSKTTAQTFDAIGSITLPDGVLNTANNSLEVTVRISVEAKPTAASDSDDRGGGNNPPIPEKSINVQEEQVSAFVNSSTRAVEINLNQDILGRIFNNTAAGEDGIKTAVVEMPASESGSYSLGLPVAALTNEEENRNITMITDTANLVIPDNILADTQFADAETVVINVEQGDKSRLPKEIIDVLGDRPLIELSMIVDGKQQSWNNSDSPITVSMAYTPTPEELEDPEHITVWYIDGAGNVLLVPSARYDPATGMVTFETTHFSSYAAVYVQKTFSDISDIAWAKQQIEVLSPKGILRGTDESKYSPKENITRTDYLYSLVRTLGLDAKIDSSFSDVGSDKYYYKEIAIAKKLGITTGIGNNLFDPEGAITRQDMMVLTERAMRKLDLLDASDDIKSLEKYQDKQDISDYARISIANLVKEGLIEGAGDRMNPKDNTTRAEAAAVLLYIIYKNK